ncbi:cobalamin biosynthesis protein CobW [Varunaivibrio sulfuroxidans]|uniref:Cobalamin biosynthesis protein CobW n=1 Tax=Varunaivibrio sulfuroxidans TaxID=1773489 RepID=A0A4R3JID2_9PROT|nr:cobalamin biosynthesis protein CobW [Varunaivibrio sulfuroxidans]TCS65143.1 cobalamin biosynthesis protein CobW [Varunaivibrio sulfuroxidans]WES29572.1 cobalamin biosynthesis protein CobW [Varunaivibrio sulfuroxidans]
MKIPATVITGFLGSGKTTLIRHLLENPGGKRIALIINEFGDLGVDRELVTGCAIEGCRDEDVVELANGCICCTVADDFLPVMEDLIHRDAPPDHIVIETSGLALPKPLIKAFQWPEIRSRVTVDGVVAVVDAPAYAAGRFADDPEAVQAQRDGDENLDHDNPLEEVFTDQVLAADLVLMNKSDLLDGAVLQHASETLALTLRAGVKVVATDHGRIDAGVLLGLDATAEDDLDMRPSHHDGAPDHDHDDFESFVIELGSVSAPEMLEDALRDAVEAHDILRIKGFVDVPGKPMRHVIQGVGPRFTRYFDRPWGDGERATRLVVIGERGIDRAAIDAALAAFRVEGAQRPASKGGVA